MMKTTTGVIYMAQPDTDVILLAYYVTTTGPVLNPNLFN